MGTTSEKLTYLNTTKSKIRDSINLTGANLTSEDTFRSYASKLKKGYIDIINNGIDTLYNNFPKVSGIGSNLSLTPTYEAPMKLNEIQGNTLQDGTPTPDTPVPIQSVTGLQNIEVCGKNLINSVAKSGNRLFFNGGTDAGVGTFKAGTYTISYTSQNTITTYIKNTDGTQTNLGTNKAITFTSNKDFDLWLYRSGITVEEVSNIQLEQGSTATEYEPYKGNTYEVNLGKNLCKEVIMQNAETIKLNANNKYLKQTFSISLIPTITISQMSVVVFADNKNLGRVGYIDLTNNTKSSATITLTDSVYKTILNATAVNFNLYKRDAGIDTTSTIKEPQIENGSVTSYSPYFTPIELNKIGDYQDSIKKSTGKNLFDINGTVTQGTLDKYNNGFTLVKGTNRVIRFVLPKVLPAGTYTLSYDVINSVHSATGDYFFINCQYGNNNTNILQNVIINDNGTTFTTTSEFDRLYFFIASNQDDTATITIDNVQLEQNNQATSYEPYGKVWYVEKNIGKVVLDGSEGWEIAATYTNNVRFNSTIFLGTTTPLISNYFLEGKGGTDTTNIDTNGNSGVLMITIPNSIATTVSNLTTWLSTHNTEVLYVLATPEYTEITNTELIEDLETLYTAKSQDGTTNISITSEDLEMILNVSALKGDA